MAVLSDKCEDVHVTVVDIDHTRIAAWQSDRLPIYEPGLDQIVSRQINKKLFFSTNIEKHIQESDLIFICVNTPTKTQGFGSGYSCDTTYVEMAARSIATSCKDCDYKIVIEKSTVPVRCGDVIKTILNSQGGNCQYSILSNPEFLAEGSAINDLLFPDRVLIGGEDTDQGRHAQSVLANLYKQWVDEDKILLQHIWSSELSKLVANCFLAQRISSINSITAICEATGARISDVEVAIGTDHRIGGFFLNSGVGFGGSCFRKDVLNLVYICRSKGLNEVADYWLSVINMNNYQMDRFSQGVINHLFGSVTYKGITVLGFAFKSNTGDTRDSPAIRVSRNLLANGAKLNIYDPKVSKSQILSDLSPSPSDPWKLDSAVTVFDSVLSAVSSCDAVLVLTESAIEVVNWEAVFIRMRKPAFVFDGRQCVDRQLLTQIGFKVSTIGEPSYFDCYSANSNPSLPANIPTTN
ncbi:hypothetical protein GEMRC1_007563 [Eukaryota sp. GEM-RC1]